MGDRFSEPVDWKALVVALAVWAAHFSALWAAASVFPDRPAARWIALVLTLAALAALGFLWRKRVREGRWSIPALGIGLAAAAIALGGLPALVG